MYLSNSKHLLTNGKYQQNAAYTYSITNQLYATIPTCFTFRSLALHPQQVIKNATSVAQIPHFPLLVRDRRPLKTKRYHRTPRFPDKTKAWYRYVTTTVIKYIFNNNHLWLGHKLPILPAWRQPQRRQQTQRYVTNAFLRVSCT